MWNGIYSARGVTNILKTISKPLTNSLFYDIIKTKKGKKMKRINLDNRLKEKVLVYQKYIRPLIKKENPKIETVKMTKQDEKFYSHLEKEWNIKKNIILEAFIYYNIIEDLKEKNRNIISIYEFFINLNKPDKLRNKELFLTEKNVLTIK